MATTRGRGGTHRLALGGGGQAHRCEVGVAEAQEGRAVDAVQHKGRRVRAVTVRMQPGQDLDPPPALKKNMEVLNPP